MRSLSCGTMRRRAPKNYNLEETTTSNKEKINNFWEIEGYEVVLDRCNDGNEICENLISMIKERAQVEENYSKSLVDWQNKWTEFLKKESKEYGSAKDACQGMLDTAEKIARKHSQLQFSLIDETKSPVAEIKLWMKQYYSKSHVHFKKRNEFLEQFKYAQKPWADFCEELKKAEKHYHNSVKDSRKSEKEANEADKNPKVKDSERSKLKKEAANKKESEAKELKQYKNKLDLAPKFQPNYLQEMKTVFERTQAFEILRKEFCKDIYKQFKSCFVNAALYEGNVKEELFKEFTDKTTKMDSNKDVTAWSQRYGPGMEPQWPTFVEYS